MNPNLLPWILGHIDCVVKLLSGPLISLLKVHHLHEVVKEVESAIYALNRAHSKVSAMPLEKP